MVQNFQSTTLLEAEKIALSILKQVMEEKLTSSNVEIVTIKPIIDENGSLLIASLIHNQRSTRSSECCSHLINRDSLA